MKEATKMVSQHLEKVGCIINIREGLKNIEGQAVTSIEILPDQGWKLDGTYNNRIIKEVSK